MSLADIRKPQSVKQAVAEFDRMGRDTFLRKYGFRRSRGYFLKIGDRTYDSKAIIGAAHGYEFPDQGPLKPSDFSGGEATVRRKLEHLHFEVLILPKGAPPRSLDKHTSPQGAGLALGEVVCIY